MAQPTGHEEVLAAWRALPPDLLAGLPTEPDVVKDSLLHPALLDMIGRTIGPISGTAILEVGCGTGDLAVLLAARGARVTAWEPSPALAAHARAAAGRRGVLLQVVERDLLGVEVTGGRDGEPAGFDVVIASLVLCGIPDLDAAVAACVRSARPGGLLVIAIEHPCYEQDLRTWTRTGRATITRYLSEYELPGSIAPDFHRPLSTYLNALLRSGSSIVGVDEPRIDETVLDEHPYLTPLRELPLFLVITARAPS